MKKRKYFFSEGVRFECQQCGFCCTGSSGTIFVSANDIKEIAKFLKITEEDFIKKYLYPFKNSYSIKEKEDGDCLFYENGCKIYPVRPNQCRTYPFWVKNLRNEKNWERTKKECIGIGKGKLYTEEEILDILEKSEI